MTTNQRGRFTDDYGVVGGTVISRRELFRGAAIAGVIAPSAAGLLTRMAQAQAPASGQPAARNQTLIYLESSEIRTLDPAGASETQSINPVRAAYEGLVGMVPNKAEITPRLAESWQISDDARVYTFKIRRGVRFHDGTLLNATAVKKSFDRTIQLNLATAASLAIVDQIQVLGESTLQITLKEPNAYFVENLTQIGIISPTAWEKNDKGGDMGSAWLESNTAGTGPYRLTDLRRNERHILDRFDGYWRGWNGDHLQKIVFLVVPEPTTRRQMLERRQAHAARGFPADAIEALKSVPGISVGYIQNFFFHTMPLNTKKPPLDNVRVRRALQMAFDYHQFLNQVWSGKGTVPTGPTAPGWPGFNTQLPAFKHDVEGARRLLAEAGVRNVTLKAFYTQTVVEQRQSLVLLQDSLKRVGLDLEVTPMPWATQFRLVHALDTAPHMTNLIIGPTRLDPVFTLEWMFGCGYSGKPYNWSYYCNAQVQRLIDAARTTADRRKSVDLLRQANKLIVDDAPVIWYAQPFRVDTYSSKLQNYAPIVVGYPGELDWYPMYLSV